MPYTETPTLDTAACASCGVTLTRYTCTNDGNTYDQWYAPGESGGHIDPACEHEIF